MFYTFTCLFIRMINPFEFSKIIHTFRFHSSYFVIFFESQIIFSSSFIAVFELIKIFSSTLNSLIAFLLYCFILLISHIYIYKSYICVYVHTYTYDVHRDVTIHYNIYNASIISIPINCLSSLFYMGVHANKFQHLQKR